MLKQIIFPLIALPSLLFSMSIIQVKEASPDGLGCIKGIGEKKLQQIINYQKETPLKRLNDLLKVKGIGEKTLENIKEDMLKKSCQREKRDSIPKKFTPSRKKELNAK